MGGRERNGGMPLGPGYFSRNLNLGIHGRGLGRLQYQIGGMDKEGEEGPKDDYIDNFPLSHDIRRRHKGSCGNVDDTRRPIQTEDSCHFMPTTTSVQHNEDDGRRWGYEETSSESQTTQTANRGVR